MTKREIQFSNMEEILQFCNLCKNIDADIDVKYKNKWIDGKSLLGLMGLDTGQKLQFVVYGEDSEAVDKHFKEFLS